MMSSINYKETLFNQAYLTPIRGEPTFEMIHKLLKDIKQTPIPSTPILEEEHMATSD